MPISGSATVTSFLAILTDPHRAIGLASFFFLLSGIIRVWFFRKQIRWDEVRTLLLFSVPLAAVGALSLVSINEILLLSIILAFSAWFFLKKIKLVKKSETKPHTTKVVGALSGFLQGAGLGGSDLRNSYLFGKGLDIAEVHGTTALVGAANFLVATIVRLLTKQLTIPDLLPLVYLFPVILLGIVIGRKILFKLNKKITDAIVILVMLLIIIFLARKIVLLVV